MRSILTVATPAATPYRLTTLARVKQELGIVDSAGDALLLKKIDEAGSDIQAALGFTVARESVVETFRAENGEVADKLILNRAPVASVASVTLDGETVAAGEYEVDAAKGFLHRLDPSGYAATWVFSKAMVVTYIGGYILPGNTGANLEPAIEAGVIDLVTSFWLSRGRDPMVRGEEVPGVLRTDYWVGAVGESGNLPPSVLAKIARFRRPSV